MMYTELCNYKRMLQRKGTKKDEKLIIELLTRSFNDDKSVNYMVIQNERRIERITALMNYSFEMCYHFGEILISENNNGCALLLYWFFNTKSAKLKLLKNQLFQGRFLLDEKSRSKGRLFQQSSPRGVLLEGIAIPSFCYCSFPS